jgi:single-strand DNA-binding protein
MPSPVNRVQIQGNLTSDPRINIVEKGSEPLKIASFGLAFDWFGKKLTPAWFFDCTAFGKVADMVEKFLKKGTKVLITDGYLHPESYTKKDGTKVKLTKIIIKDFIMVGLNKPTEGQDIDAIEEQLADVDEVPW